MEDNKYNTAINSSKRLIQDEHYYKYIFKKTERIVSVVFYVLQNIEVSDRTKLHLEDITHSARQVHDNVLHSLETLVHASEDAVRASAHSLITLESKLRVAHVAGILPKETLDVFSAEIDSVLRGMNKYMQKHTDFVFGEVFPLSDRDEAPRVARPKSPRKQIAPSDTAGATPSTLQRTLSPMERRDRIKTVLEAKGMAGIKDIAEIISDVSEKTIQRELNAMIEDNLIKRHGERRWSKYSIL